MTQEPVNLILLNLVDNTISTVREDGALMLLSVLQIGYDLTENGFAVSSLPVLDSCGLCTASVALL